MRSHLTRVAQLPSSRKSIYLTSFVASTNSPRLFGGLPSGLLESFTPGTFKYCGLSFVSLAAEALLAPSGLFLVLTDSMRAPLGQAWSGLLYPFFGRRISKRYAFWNLLAQTFKQNALFITFFGPGKIKCRTRDGCQESNCHFFRACSWLNQGAEASYRKIRTSKLRVLRRVTSA